MIGFLLLSFAIIAYITRKKILSLTIFFCFALEGFQLFTNKITGIKLGDLAVIYVLIITLYNVKTIPHYFKKSIFSKTIFLFLGLLGITSIYSIIHYNFTLFQVFQATRDYYCILSYFFLIRLKPNEVHKLLKVFSIITVIIAIIYICQITIAHQPLLPYNNIDKIQFDPTTGLIRLYNSPILLYFFIFLSFLSPGYYKRKSVKILFIITLLCTLGRTGIATVLLLLFFGLFITRQFKSNWKILIIAGVIILPLLGGVIIKRFNSSDQTSSDLEYIISGELTTMNMGDFTDTGATLAYRFAWIYERLDYLIQQDDTSELLMGLGMISDNQPIASKMYHFSLGLNNEDTNRPFQLGTPDIAWGNILCRFGILGIFFYLFFWIKIIKILWKPNDKILFSGSLYILAFFLTSITSSMISYTTFMTFPFLLMALINNNYNNGKRETNYIDCNSNI